jgi:histidinol-phosphate aminotransferase
MATTIKDKVKQWIRPAIRELSAYHVPDAAGMVKLDAMENPYQLSDAMQDEWLQQLRAADVNRYPDPSARQVVASLRNCMGIPDSAAVLLGNGSDEIIQMILLALADRDRCVVAPEPTFVMYDMIARFTGMQYTGVPLMQDFSLDLPAMLATIEAQQPAVIFLAYPNNPTGNLFDAAAVETIIQASPGLVVVDEAYSAFADHSFMSRLGEFENLLLMGTLSKMGLAGLRLGFLAGPAEWLTEIDKVRLPYNINSLTQHSARYYLQHKDVLDEQANRIRTDRDSLVTQLQKLDGITVYPSQTNFVLFRTPTGQATRIFNALKNAGVLIKNLDTPGALQDCLRVTVGTPRENEAFVTALRNVWG